MSYSDFRMTLKYGLGKCSLFVLSANGTKHGLFVFPPKKTLILNNLLQYDVKAKNRLILEVLGHEVFSPEGVRLINQKPHAFVSAR